MDDKSLSDQLSQLINDTPEIPPDSVEQNAGPQPDVLVDSLMAVAGQSDGALETALDDFMNGKGVLHEASRSALTRGGSSGLNEIVQLLTSQFKLSPAVAKMIASLIMKLQPSGSQETEKETAAKKKPRRKAKPKTAAAKKEAKSAKKKKAAAKAKKSPSKAAAKKKAASKTKPRSEKKTASKKKPAAKTAKKKAVAKAKPKKAKRASPVEVL